MYVWLLLPLVMASVLVPIPGVASAGEAHRGVPGVFYYFLHITDLHLGSDKSDKGKLALFTQRVKNMYMELPVKPLAVLNTGDIGDQPEHLEVYTWYRSTMSSLGLPVLNTSGNHDAIAKRGINMAEEYRRVLGSPQYYRDIGLGDGRYVRFIVVNTSVINRAGGYIGRDTLTWVERLVEEAEADPMCIDIWVAGHHAPSPPGSRDYRATPYDDLSGEAAGLVELIEGHGKVAGYIYGHVHTNWVTFHGGKLYVSTAPLTMRGPWPGGIGRFYDGIGYAYRVVIRYNDTVTPLIARVDDDTVAAIIGLRGGEMLWGRVTVYAFIASTHSLEDANIRLLVDDKPAAVFTPLEASSHGGVYRAVLDTDEYPEWLHRLRVLVQAGGESYTSPPVYVFFRSRGGLFLDAENITLGYGVRETQPVIRLYNHNESRGYAVLYTGLEGGAAEALLETEHIWRETAETRYGLVLLPEKPWGGWPPSRFTAGIVVEGLHGDYPYTLYTYSNTGGYARRDTVWPVTWLRVALETGEGGATARWSSGATNVWRAPGTRMEYSGAEPRYIGVATWVENGLTQVMIGYIRVRGPSGAFREYPCVPGITDPRITVNATLREEGGGRAIQVSIHGAGQQEYRVRVLGYTGEGYRDITETRVRGNATIRVPGNYTGYRVLVLGNDTEPLAASPLLTPTEASPQPLPQGGGAAGDYTVFIIGAAAAAAVAAVLVLLRRRGV